MKKTYLSVLAILASLNGKVVQNSSLTEFEAKMATENFLSNESFGKIENLISERNKDDHYLNDQQIQKIKKLLSSEVQVATNWTK